jgi:Carbohydrate binding domain
MPDITELRDTLTNLEVPDRGIEEPLSAPDLFNKKLSRFQEELYNLHQDSHLYRFLLALCGEGGAGSIKKEILYSKLQGALASTHFHDLDRLYGDPLALPRVSSEIYTYDPKNEVLTQREWTEIYAKDANYRNRCLLWMRAIIYGGSPMGIKLAAEAACGVECDLFAVADYNEDLRSDHPTGIINIGRTVSDGELVIVPRINALTQAEQHRIIAMVDRIRPVDTLITISLGSTVRTQKFPTSATSTSDFSTVQRFVTGRTDISWPDVGWPESTNLVGNGGAELNISGWVASGAATLSRVSNAGQKWREGSFMFQFVPTGTAQGMRTSAQIPVTPNTVYTFSAYVNDVVAKNFKLQVDEFTSAGASVQTDQVTYPGAGVMNRFSLTFTTAATTGLVHLYILNQDASNPTIFTEGIQLEALAVASPYISTTTGPKYRARKANNGLWIESGVEKEAPTYAWISRQESATFLEVTNVTSSSEHFGDFSKVQRDIFPHLALGTEDQFFQYADDFSYTQAFAQIGLGIPWMRNDQVFVNNYYPLEYLSKVDLTPFNVSPSHRFWASQEVIPPESGLSTEFLKFDFGRNRPLNYVDFEIAQKPIDITVEYSIDNVNWIAVSPTQNTDYTYGISFIVSEQPWRFWRLYFDKVTARYVRLTFTRRDENFPFGTTEPFPWSIEVRNFRAVHLMQDADDFEADTGTDILGNPYRNVLSTFPAGLSLDGDNSTFWMSQPNPTPNAVEALYFDVSTSLHAVTMSELDTGLGGGGNVMTDYDNLSMSNMESYVSGVGTQTIDEIFIDPVFSGSDMHFYWSVDPQPDWESKLWHPVPIHYKCTRGFHAFPYPVTARYFKVEFSNLTPIPYNTLEYPQLLPPLYRKFPSWVQNYFSALTPDVLNSFLEEGQTVTIDPYDMFKIQKDILATTRDQQVIKNEETSSDDTDEINQLVDKITSGQDESIQLAQETQIRFFPPTIWRDDLKNVLDLSRAASRIVWQDSTDQFMVEVVPEILDAPDEQSAEDLTAERAQKIAPVMWFPRVCRHGYQVVTGPFQAKIAYQVAIREVTFWYRGFVTPGNSEFGQSTYGSGAYG